jgi:hypothetical protein
MKHAILKNFTLIVGMTTLSILLGVAGFNALVDPYRIFNIIDKQGFNHEKPAIYKRARLLKAYEVRRIEPDAIILGSSRSHVGISPEHRSWKCYAQRPYNLAFDGATTKEMYYYLVHAQSVRPLKLVLMGIDLYHPTEAPGAVRPDFDPSILGTPSRIITLARFLFSDFKILTSFDCLVGSYQTLRGQNANEEEWFARDGQRIGEIFFHQSSEDFEKIGPRYYFDEVDKMEVKWQLEWRIPTPGIKVYPPKIEASDPVTSLGYILKIVEFCRQKNIELRIFFTPAHAHQMELSKFVREWPQFEKGKRALVSYLAEDARRHPGLKPVLLFDFSGYSIYTTEALPPVGSRQEMQYYWDSSHFKSIVGDKILDRVLSEDIIPTDDSGGFGVLLRPDNIEDVLSSIHRDSLEYEVRYPEEMATLRKYIADFKLENRIKD